MNKKLPFDETIEEILLRIRDEIIVEFKKELMADLAKQEKGQKLIIALLCTGVFVAFLVLAAVCLAIILAVAP